MITKYTKEEFDSASKNVLLPLECEFCGKEFYRKKYVIQCETSLNRGRLKYCSDYCKNASNRTSIQCNCENCGKEIKVTKSVYNKSKTKHFFCSKSCSATYNNSKRPPVSDEQKKKCSESLKKFYGTTDVLKVEKNNNKNKRKIRICNVCGKEYIWDRKSKNGTTRRFCSHECSLEFKQNMKKYLSEESIERIRERM